MHWGREWLGGCNAHSIVLDDRLDLGVASDAMYVWARCAVRDGIAGVEMGSRLQVLHSERVAASVAEQPSYVSSWSFAK